MRVCHGRHFRSANQISQSVNNISNKRRHHKTKERGMKDFHPRVDTNDLKR